MPLYKQVLLTNLKATPKDVSAVFQECARLITSHGGVVRSTENRGEKRLGYGVEDRRWGELQRHYEGKLIVSQFNTSPPVLHELELKLKNSFPILRFQTFQVRDPLDKLLNTRASLDQIKAALSAKPPSATAKAAAAAVDAEAEDEAKDEDFSPELLFDTEEEEEHERFKRYVPEWKRDAMYTPSPPEHLKK
jgi:ribosomal protein S6